MAKIRKEVQEDVCESAAPETVDVVFSGKSVTMTSGSGTHVLTSEVEVPEGCLGVFRSSPKFSSAGLVTGREVFLPGEKVSPVYFLSKPQGAALRAVTGELLGIVTFVKLAP